MVDGFDEAAGSPPGADFPERLARALRDSPLSLEQHAQELAMRGTPVSAATLSYWSTGRSLPQRARSLQAVAQLERLLGLAPGWLVGTLPAMSPSGWQPLAVLPAHPGLQEALARLGVGLERDVSVQVLRDRLVVCPGRLTRRVFQLVRVERPGVDRLVVVHELPRGAGWQLVTPADGLRAEVVELEAAAEAVPRVLVTCTRLDKTLAPGEFALLHQQLVITDVDPDQEQSCQLVTPRPDGTHRLVQEVAFEKDLPAWIRRTHLPPGSDEPAATGSLAPAAEAQWVQHDAPAGRHVLSWGW